MLHFDQYFRLVCSDLMYGGDKVMNYVIFCSRVKIGGAGTFAFPPSTIAASHLNLIAVEEEQQEQDTNVPPSKEPLQLYTSHLSRAIAAN